MEEEKAKSEKYLANWQRAEADLANFKRRAEQERTDLARYSNLSLIRKILPVLDDFERAIESIPADVQSEGWVEGVKLIDRKLRNVLEQEGVNAIEADGKEFDPHIHEAVMHERGRGRYGHGRAGVSEGLQAARPGDQACHGEGRQARQKSWFPR